MTRGPSRLLVAAYLGSLAAIVASGAVFGCWWVLANAGDAIDGFEWVGKPHATIAIALFCSTTLLTAVASFWLGRRISSDESPGNRPWVLPHIVLGTLSVLWLLGASLIPYLDVMNYRAVAAVHPGASATLGADEFGIGWSTAGQVSVVTFCGTPAPRPISADTLMLSLNGNRVTYLGPEPGRIGLFRLRVDRTGCADTELVLPGDLFAGVARAMHR